MSKVCPQCLQLPSFHRTISTLGAFIFISVVFGYNRRTNSTHTQRAPREYQKCQQLVTVSCQQCSVSTTVLTPIRQFSGTECN